MKHLKKILLTAVACIVINNPFGDPLRAAVPSRVKGFDITDLYDVQMLKRIVDSLKLLDVRNSVTPAIGTFIQGTLFFKVELYSNEAMIDKQNVTVEEIGIQKNRCIGGALALARQITPCAYDTVTVHVGVNYVDDNQDAPLFGTIMNVNKPGSPCRAVSTWVDQ